jgi:hypothetical protein
MSTLGLIPDKLLSALGLSTASAAERTTSGGINAGNEITPNSNAGTSLTSPLTSFLSSQGGGALQSYRFQQLSLGFQSVQIAAQRTSVADGVMRTATLLARRVTIDLRISSAVLERYAESVSKLQDTDPKLLEDLLGLISLLDGSTPESFDPFFERLRAILSGDPGAQVQQPQGAVVDINVPVPEGVDTSEQVSAFFLHVRISVTTIQFTSTTQQAQKGDPLVLDLDDDGVELTSHKKGNKFDLNADGRTDRAAFVTGGDAFLALDRNGNGAIDDGSELFGEHHGAADGFSELARFDDNRDGAIDVSDSVFSRLFLFDGARLRRLADAGVVSILTSMNGSESGEVNGNEILGTSRFLRADGSSGSIAEALLNYV